LLKFAESGQLYRGAKPVMWSPVEKTALAEAEVEYEDITSTQIDVAFEITESPIAELVGAYAVIWTTTPWTIPANQALAYGPEVDYHLYRADDGRRFLVAVDLLGTFLERTGLAPHADGLTTGMNGRACLGDLQGRRPRRHHRPPPHGGAIPRERLLHQAPPLPRW
jgi:isoleucyl-tRNA synthetase